jgi:hypothetical protein
MQYTPKIIFECDSDNCMDIIEIEMEFVYLRNRDSNYSGERQQWYHVGLTEWDKLEDEGWIVDGNKHTCRGCVLEARRNKRDNITTNKSGE